MIVELDTGSIVVLNADDCTRLHVTAKPGIDVDASLRAAELGSLDVDGNARLEVERLRALAEAVALRDDWGVSWQRMVEYAASKGWTTSDGRWLIAHVESDHTTS